MKTALLIIALAVSASAQTSNVEEVRAWTRTHILGIPGGGVIDPTGTIADAQRMAAVSEVNARASNIVAAAQTGLSNALQRLTTAAAATNNFTGRLYISADLDSDPDYQNVEAMRISETYDPDGTIHYFTHYTRVLSDHPRTIWRFDLDDGTSYWADGSYSTNNATTNINGYACYDIRVTRPTAVGNCLLLSRRFLRFGAPGRPLDIPDAGLRIVSSGQTNSAFTGSVCYTNSVTNAVTEIYLSGFLKSITTNTVEQTP